MEGNCDKGNISVLEADLINNLLYKNKYRIPSARLLGYDYSSEGAYFITICTRMKRHYFGKIVKGEMQFSPIGLIVKEEWIKTAQIRENVDLSEWVVMPNHFHAIIILKDTYRRDVSNTSRIKCLKPYRDVSKTYQNDSGDLFDRSLRKEQMSSISPTRDSVSNIIKLFKGAVTKRSSLLNKQFKWQARFHDHIIRNEQEYLYISNYIINNPLLWDNDSLNSSSDSFRENPETYTL